ncbi:hypothetical protein OJ22_06780 [Proteus mirabilis]|nr:hypothetical protein OJ22_06780 [Proteus mirabilis]
MLALATMEATTHAGEKVDACGFIRRKSLVLSDQSTRGMVELRCKPHESGDKSGNIKESRLAVIVRAT